MNGVIGYGIRQISPLRPMGSLPYFHTNVFHKLFGAMKLWILMCRQKKKQALKNYFRTHSAATFLLITVSLLPRTTSLHFSLKMLSAEEIVLMIFFFLFGTSKVKVQMMKFRFLTMPRP